MAGSPPEPAGVMDGRYAAARRESVPLRFRYRLRALVAARAAREHLGRATGLRVLDIGCADGRTLLALRVLLPGGTYVGVERSDALLASAPPLPPDTRLVRGDVLRLPAEVRARCFDLATALAVLEHLADPVAAARGMARVLAPGGILVATCPHPAWDRIAGALGLLDAGAHEARLGRESLLAIAREAGLEPIAYARFLLAPVGFLPYLRIGIRPAASVALDRWVRRLRVLDALFVNQSLVARRP